MTAITVRSLLLSALIIALAGPESRRENQGVAVFYLLDRSDSISDASKSRHEAFVRDAISRLGTHDVAGVIAFGREPVLESVCAGRRDVGPVQSKVDASHSDLASAIRLASAAFPSGKGRRIVLLSDGNETRGDLAESAEMLAAEHIELGFASLLEIKQRTEAAVTDLEILAMRSRVSGVTGTWFSRSARPKPSLQTSSPSTITATWAPGTRSEAMLSRMAWRAASICAV